MCINVYSLSSLCVLVAGSCGPVYRRSPLFFGVEFSPIVDRDSVGEIGSLCFSSKIWFVINGTRVCRYCAVVCRHVRGWP